MLSNNQSALPNDYLSAATLNNCIYEITVLGSDVGYIQFAFDTPADVSAVIVTVNEEIE